jgi:hypothetical protein
MARPPGAARLSLRLLTIGGGPSRYLAVAVAEAEAEAARASGFSRQTVYRAIGRGDLRASVVCSRIRIHPDDFRCATSRVFDPLTATVGMSGMRPYDLRHAFCSLLIGEGMSVVVVARQAGHTPTMTLALATYAHVIADLDGSERVSAEASIRAAREAEVSGTCPREPDTMPAHRDNPCVRGMGDPGLEPGTSSLSEKRSNRLS